MNYGDAATGCYSYCASSQSHSTSTIAKVGLPFTVFIRWRKRRE